MSGAWREAYRLHRWAYPELAYQAIYAVRQGNIPPSIPPKALARTALRRVLQSKILVSGLLGLVSLGSIALLSPRAEALLIPALSPALYEAAVLVGLLLLELALLWWTGLQVLPTYLASPILPTFESLPLSEAVVERSSFLLFLRLFDLPIATMLLLTPIAVGVAFHSALAGLAIVPGVLSVVVFALALSLATGRFFVRHVQSAPGGAGRAALRWAYLVLWATPAFAMYGFLTIGPRFLEWLAGTSGSSGTLETLLAAYPFPLASLPALVSTGTLAWASPSFVDLVIVGSGAVLYGAIALGLSLWLLGAPRAIARTLSEGSAGSDVPLRISPDRAAWAVVVKDLRIASRTPGYAFLILLPLLDAAAIGVWTLFAGHGPVDAFNIATGAVATAALLATFFGPAFFAIELMGYSYTRTLPLSERSLILGKVGLVSLLYAASAGTVLGIALGRLFDPALFVVFVLAELPAVAAAALLEVGILARVARRRGLPITNLYSGSWWATAVSVPGVVVAGAPLALYAFGPIASGIGGVAAMGVLSLLELVVASAFTLVGSGGGIA